mgnify:CR=1 FL=1
MNLINKHLNKDNLHHAYLVEGARDEIVSQVLKFCEELDIKTLGNPDFVHISIDNFKIEDARNLKSYTAQKSFSSTKKIFIISANNFLLEAQNSLLKIFEEPIENTLFFLIVPDINALLKTLVSRFYLISARPCLAETENIKDAEKFITMPLKNRIDFIKELLIEPEEDLEAEPPSVGGSASRLDSSRTKALKFLNALETSLHNKIMSRTPLDIDVVFFKHFFKVREFLRMPGSSTKTLMESVALVAPMV